MKIAVRTSMRSRGLVLLLSCSFCVSAGAADDANDTLLPHFDLNGEITARYEQYGREGATGASPFQFTGEQHFVELNLNLSRRFSAYETLRGSAFGLVNDSRYRNGTNRGAFFERLNLTWEKGDSAIPFRAQAGDFFGFLSLRTLQRGLKGGQIELQPRMELFDQPTSIVLFSGNTEPLYRSFEADEDLYTGASWLVTDSRLGNWSVNLVNNYRKDDQVNNLSDRSQWTGSIAGRHQFEWSGQSLTLDAEYARFYGDFGGANSLQRNQHDDGVFLELQGRSDTPLTYSVRFEQYGEDFRPNGASSTPDRRSLEARAGWRFENGVSLSARAQRFVDSLESTNPSTNQTAGVSLSGPIENRYVDNLNMSFDGFVQDVRNKNRTTDSDTVSSTLNLSGALGNGWNGRLGLFYQNATNVSSATTVTRQLTFGADRSFQLLGYQGSLSPGVQLRSVSGSNSNTDDISPSVAVSLAKGAHRFDASYRVNVLDRRDANATDTTRQNLSLRYGYTSGQHSIGLEGELDDQNPTPGTFTTAYKLGLTYRYRFDRPSLARREQQRIQSAGSGFAPVADIAAIAPAARLERSMASLASAGISGALEQADALIYETRYFRTVDQRQRLALVHDDGRIRVAGVIIDLPVPTDSNAVSRTFSDVREELISRYGAPAQTFEESAFDANFVSSVNSGRFLRILEWNTPAGGVLRLGIPRRVDGQIRIEVQHAAGFGSPRDTNWSLESVR
ncbi:MAG: hypothetical protein AAF417_19925 [Pseudomonadota bacterium]